MINPLCGTFFLGSLLWMIFGAMIIPEEKLEKKKMAFSLSIIWALFALIVK